jgi:hypothetical protein
LICFADLRGQAVNTAAAPSGFNQRRNFPDRRAIIIDTLSARLDRVTVARDTLLRAARRNEEAATRVKVELARLRTENKTLKEQLEESRGDNLQSAHTNSVLFIFNLVVGLFLLLALLWLFVKRKSDGVNMPAVRKAQVQEEVKAPLEVQFDHKLDRIQKLGGLRDKGLLTDEEFIVQKKQILGE